MTRRKIDQLKDILDSQEGDIDDWPAVLSDIQVGTNAGEDNQLSLVCKQQQVGFCFDKTGEKLLGMYNWKW